jgi:hypothetical protein
MVKESPENIDGRSGSLEGGPSRKCQWRCNAARNFNYTLLAYVCKVLDSPVGMGRRLGVSSFQNIQGQFKFVNHRTGGR